MPRFSTIYLTVIVFVWLFCCPSSLKGQSPTLIHLFTQHFLHISRKKWNYVHYEILCCNVHQPVTSFVSMIHCYASLCSYVMSLVCHSDPNLTREFHWNNLSRNVYYFRNICPIVVLIYSKKCQFCIFFMYLLYNRVILCDIRHEIYLF